MRISRVLMAAVLVVGVGVTAAGRVDAAPNGAVPNVPAVQSGFLVDVACPAAASCFAVGAKFSGSNMQTLAKHWNGTAWSTMTTPNPTLAQNSGTRLNGIACASPTSCFAVGSTSVNFVAKTYIMRWNGSVWATVAVPVLAGTNSSAFNHVACVTAANCFAVGAAAATSDNNNKTLIEHWNGTAWAVVASPSLAGVTGASLVGVTCVSASRCFAVGGTEEGTTEAVIEIWNGAKWAVSALPKSAAGLPTLRGVTCRSATRCFAVGQAEGGTTQTLAERWDGTSWSALATPVGPDGSDRAFSGISCPNPTACFATGVADDGFSLNAKTLIERWDGAHWTVVASPNVDPSDNSLGGIACPTASSCFTVGASGSATASTIIEHWNGTAWSLSAHPQP